MKEQERAAATPSVKARGSAREFRIADYERVLALWKATDGIVLRDVDKRPAIAAYLRATEASASSGRSTRGTDVVLMSRGAG